MSLQSLTVKVAVIHYTCVCGVLGMVQDALGLLINSMYCAKPDMPDHIFAVVESITAQMRRYVSGCAWQISTTRPVELDLSMQMLSAEPS